MHDWDDLRFFLALAQTGSITAAAEKLKVNQSTVSRRINQFEKELEVRLFERFTSGYVLTSEGDELLIRAQHVEDEMFSIERQVMGKNIELSGSIRVTTTLLMAKYFIIPMLKNFHDLHPGIVVQLDISNTMYNLIAREADVAIRVTREPVPESLVGRELGSIEFAVYGEKKYLDKHQQAKPQQALRWVGEDNMQSRPSWLPESYANLQLVARTNDVLATLDLLKQGLGIGRLPTLMGDSEESLQQITLSHPLPSAPVWLLTHIDMRRVNRVRVFNEFIAEQLRSRLNAGY